MRFFIDASSARHSGALTHHIGILSALDRILSDDSCIVLGTENLITMLKGKTKKIKIEVIHTNPGFGRYYALNFSIPKIIRQYNPDACVFGQQAPINIHQPYIMRLTDAHLVDPVCKSIMKYYTAKDKLALKVMKVAFRQSLKRADSVICATRALADMLLEWEPRLDAEKVVVSHFGLSEIARMPVKHIYNNTKRLLTMHVTSHKNVELILRALALPKLRNWTLTMMTDLTRPQNNYEKFLVDLIGNFDLKNRVYYAGYKSKKDQLVECMLEHDILIIPSIMESWNHTVVEGMAIGMPVIASDISVHREVTDGAVWLVGADDTNGLAEAILEISNGGERVQEKVTRGLEVIKRYSWDEYAAIVLQRLKQAAQG